MHTVEDANTAHELSRLRLLVDNTTDAVSTATNTGVLTWVSDGITAMLGWRPEDMIGRQLGEFIHEDDYSLLVAGLPALHRGESPRAEMRARASDGGWRWVSLLRKQIFDEAGEPLYRVGGWRDVSAERAAVDALAEQHAFTRALLDAMLEPFMLFTPLRDEQGEIIDFVISDANPAALADQGMARADLLGRCVSELHPATRQAGVFEMYCNVLRTGEPLVLDDWSYAHDFYNGAIRRYDLRAVRVGDAVMQVWHDVTSRYEAAQQLQRMAHHDGLTGALNHSEALRRLTEALHNTRTPGNRLGVLFCDTDMFKHINDQYGHAVGDQVLVELTKRIAACIRKDDVVARMGGDEFLVMLPGVHALDDVMRVASKVRSAAALPMELPNRTISTSMSIGYALAEPGEHMDRLLERADIAMYHAKREGRNRVYAG